MKQWTTGKGETVDVANRSSHHLGNSYHSIVARDTAQIHAGDVNFYAEDTETRQEQICLQLFKTSIYKEYKDRNSARVEGTCQWVLTHPQFRQWRNSQHDDLLWISADPGCGKSVLAKSLVDLDLEDGGQSMVCYFFFKDNEEQDNLPTALCALLHQVFSQRPDLIRHALPTWKRNGNQLQREPRELWLILQEMAADETAPSIICVLDALDECREYDRRQLITFLCSLLQQPARGDSNNTLKFLVTSRPYDSVQRWFEQSTSQWPHLRLRGEDENEQIHQEINLVIKKQVHDLGEEFALSHDSQERLQQQLLHMQHRTYLWLHLAMDNVRETYQNSLYPDTVVIDALPPSVEEAYERLLQRISVKQRPIARQVLLIIVGARRPLKIGEMAWALAAVQAQEVQTEPLVAVDARHLERQIRNWCGLFVFIQHSTLFLIHQTAKEFLLSHSLNFSPVPGMWRASLTSTQVETEMMKLCITYLFVTQHAIKAHETDQRAEERMDGQAQEEVPHDANYQVNFFEYCAEYWAAHLQDETIAKDHLILSRILALYDPESDMFRSWFNHFWKVSMASETPHMSSQHIAAFNGHKSVMEYLYQRRHFALDARDSTGRTALHWAAERGNLDVSEWLLHKRAEVNAVGGPWRHALQAACHSGHEKVVQILLDKGANVNAQGGTHSTALQAASSAGHEAIVKILLDKNANVNVQGGKYGSALQAASWGGHVKVVRMLLNDGADVNARTGRYGRAVWAAVARRHMGIAQILFQHGAIT
ncbi:hypothetical protein OHC33_002794 [Knufia fluminis]|uniref:NACHT domain-containing protein n=1 Tax=Knufia fluminis TaxID=191047 RepID=A0AAN8EHU9_9EURO|nr:hypothetical protein OHC33_002794 [Knufia fluminis]